MELYLREIEELARTAHGSQRRKYSDEQYINHPIRVMQKCHQYNESFVTLAAALLHDVLEDTLLTRQDLESSLNSLISETTTVRQIMNVVVELTDTFTKSNYPSLNRRRRRQLEAERLGTVGYEAQTVKYADIIDNTDIALHDRHFASVYLREVNTILSLMNQGNPKLREEAVEQVAQCMFRLKLRP